MHKQKMDAVVAIIWIVCFVVVVFGCIAFSGCKTAVITGTMETNNERMEG